MNPVSESTRVVGVTPWLPRPLSSFRWWTAPIAVHYYAMLRIGVAAVLLVDQLVTMLPQLSVLYGRGSTGDPQIYSWFFDRPQLHWSLLQQISDPQAITLAFYFWIAATIGLLIGWNTRICAIVVWALSISFTNLNMYAINAGDHIHGMLLLYVMLTPCGAVWSIDALRRSTSGEPSVQLLASPWALRLLLIQFAFMYGASGLCKFSGHNWTAGDSLYYVLRDLSLTRFSADLLPTPYWVTQIMTWSVLVWETGFPLLILFRRTRIWALWFGVSMHLGIFVSMELGCFPLYLLAAYVPLIMYEYQATARVSQTDTAAVAPTALAAAPVA
ncbi:HTTM domain-containing protein [Blastopirellula retiformator]|uniref:Vitamin K-dependent gamma-carboxylase n=1 Tax=Blastopirellula retiformator TaxID=2527970 RepID=A0A5C5VMA5_9BACT|nr:HTTM domain-containing protein [Blastopirellula retiformator]TWT39005.1 Vitamin K-dependent gamma-carboxylase [Blastopirellula retiformator]